MAKLPIFVVTHPRACSTAFERVFMTRKDLQCLHEPFGDAFYYGPELLGHRFANDESGREASGFRDSTYKTVVDRIEAEAGEGKRLFIKDMAYYLMAPGGGSTEIAPSLWKKRGIGTLPYAGNESSRPEHKENAAEFRNPTVIPQEVLGSFKFTFLIRHPSRGIPSFFRCTRPPLDEVTGWDDFMPSEAGYRELRVFFEYICALQGLEPANASSEGEVSTHARDGGREDTWRRKVKKQICVIDADDLLDHPSSVVQAFCRRVDLSFDPDMLKWDTEADQQYAEKAFEKWRGWHEDALQSKGLTSRAHGKPIKSRDEEDAEWLEKFGTEGLRTIRTTVDANVQDYEYLKQFAWDPKNDDI